MNGLEIELAFADLNQRQIIPSSHRQTFRGVCSWNQLPASVASCQKATAFIINTADSNQIEGEHWIGFFSPNPEALPEIFDSYGLGPAFWIRDKESFYAKLCTYYYCCLHHPPIYNTCQLQSVSSNLCGQYCISYLVYRLLGRSFSEFLDDFNLASCCANDMHVLSFVNRTLRLHSFTEPSAKLRLNDYCSSRIQSCRSLFDTLLCTC